MTRQRGYHVTIQSNGPTSTLHLDRVYVTWLAVERRLRGVQKSDRRTSASSSVGGLKVGCVKPDQVTNGTHVEVLLLVHKNSDINELFREDRDSNHPVLNIISPALILKLHPVDRTLWRPNK